MTVEELVALMDQKPEYEPPRRNYAVLPQPLRRKLYLAETGRLEQLREEFGSEVMVYCPNCRTPIPPNKIGCPACLERKSYATSLHQQKLFLPAIVKGDFDSRLTIVRTTKFGAAHIQLIQNPERSYCGSPMESGKREPVPYDKIETTPDVCALCRQRLRELVAEITCPSA